MARKKEIKHQPRGPLVAIDVGSSQIRLMAAEQQEDNTLRILGLEEISKPRAFDKGIITNSSEVGGALASCRKLLRNRIGMHSDEEIMSAFISIGGYKMQSANVIVRRDQISRNYITLSRLKEMERECHTKIEDKYPNLFVVSVEPVRYILDDEEQTEPPTDRQKARFFTIEYDVFVVLKDAQLASEGSCQRANLGIEATFARPDTLLQALCNDDDMADGVAIIDFGHQTTTLSIYKGNRFRLNYVVPLGGYHITRDIQDMQISAAHAETAKLRFGCAWESAITESKVLRIPSTQDPTERVNLSTVLLARIIQARLEEILAPIMTKLRDYQAGDTLSKIYLTGGGAKLQQIIPFIQNYTSLPVQYGSHADWLDVETDDAFYEPQYAALIGTLILGAEYRKNHANEEIPVGPFGTGGLENIKKRIIKLFTDPENNNDYDRE